MPAISDVRVRGLKKKMPKIDRMEFPRKHPLANSAKLLVLIAIAFGIWFHGYTQKRHIASLRISDVHFENYSPAHIELGYSIENKSPRAQEVRLLAVVWDEAGKEVASILFLVKLKGGVTQQRSKLIDKLNRSLKDGEVPARAAIRVYERKIF